MPDLDSSKNNPYQFLDKISTEELKRILREDMEAEDSNDPANDEFITHVMEVVEKREAADSSRPRFDAAAGWADFQQNYRPTEEAPILMCDDAELKKLTQSNDQSQAVENTPQPKRAGHRFLRTVVVAAAAIFICAAVASAFEINIFKMFADWTQDVFQFHSEEISSREAVYASGTALKQSETLQDVLEEAGITQAVSPTWIPEGFSFSGMKAYTNVDEPMFNALYEDEETERTIIVSINEHEKPQALLQEKDEHEVAVYVAGNITHYIMENNGTIVATWFVDNLECSIVGIISDAEMETMIDSIYEE